MTAFAAYIEKFLNRCQSGSSCSSSLYLPFQFRLFSADSERRRHHVLRSLSLDIQYRHVAAESGVSDKYRECPDNCILSGLKRRPVSHQKFLPQYMIAHCGRCMLVQRLPCSCSDGTEMQGCQLLYLREGRACLSLPQSATQLPVF